MADYEIVDVTKLQKAEGVKDGDTLLLIRQQGDGTSICMRTDGAQFKALTPMTWRRLTASAARIGIARTLQAE